MSGTGHTPRVGKMGGPSQPDLYFRLTIVCPRRPSSLTASVWR